MLWQHVMATAGLLLAVLCTATASGNVLRQAGPGADPRFFDGAIAFEGDDWRSNSAVQLRGAATFDLGATRTLVGVAIQADHNDTYVISVSDDGADFREVYRAGAVAPSGLRTRAAAITATGRYVRLHGEGGDGRFSVSELALFETREAMAQSPLLRWRWLPRHPLDQRWSWLFIIAVALLIAAPARAPRWWVSFVGFSAAAYAGQLLWATLDAQALEQERLNWIRAVTAATALMVVLRTLLRGRAKVHEAIVVGALGFCGVVAVLCFVNFARPQFHDASRGQPTFLHHYDMRTYWPIARYFDELRFDGVYAASAAVVAEQRGLADISGYPMRNLRTHANQNVGQSEQYIKDVRSRFSPERWRQFVDDMNYFRRGMGDHAFLGSMQDHGGNATPVWFLAATLLFAATNASDFSLWLGVVADILLMLAAFASLWWAYGVRTAFIAMVVFGAMDFYMFGSNWFGAALRHDWMALWCIGVALLKRERYFLAGGMLAWAGLIRAFPALTFIALSMPVLWALGQGLLTKRRAFSVRTFFAEQRAFVRVCAGAAAIGGTLLLLSVFVFGVDAWTEWFHKVFLLNSSSHVNNIALSRAGFPVGVTKAAALVITVGTLVAVRNSPLDEAAAFGTALVGIVFSPANYYMHCLFILVVLGRERQGSRMGAFAWVVLLAMCVACYFTNLTGDLNNHFMWETWTMLAAVTALVAWRMAESFVPQRRQVEALAPRAIEAAVQ